jgi:hypothetical protein
MNHKEIKCPLQKGGGGGHETMFPTVDIFSLLNLRHYRIANGNWKDFFFSDHTYKPKEMLFTIKNFREFDI